MTQPPNRVWEYREIRFSDDALRAALNRHLSAVVPRAAIPGAAVGDISVVVPSPLQLRVVVYGVGGKPREIRVETTELAAILLREARARGLKADSAGLRALRRDDGFVALVFEHADAPASAV